MIRQSPLEILSRERLDECSETVIGGWRRHAWRRASCIIAVFLLSILYLGFNSWLALSMTSTMGLDYAMSRIILSDYLMVVVSCVTVWAMVMDARPRRDMLRDLLSSPLPSTSMVHMATEPFVLAWAGMLGVGVIVDVILMTKQSLPVGTSSSMSDLLLQVAPYAMLSLVTFLALAWFHLATVKYLVWSNAYLVFIGMRDPQRREIAILSLGFIYLALTVSGIVVTILMAIVSGCFNILLCGLLNTSDPGLRIMLISIPGLCFVGRIKLMLTRKARETLIERLDEYRNWGIDEPDRPVYYPRNDDSTAEPMVLDYRP